MTRATITRLAAALVAIAAFLPWYSSQAQVDQDTYIGNPLPWIDWVVVALAALTLIWPRVGLATAAVGLISVASAGLLMYGDASEGLEVSLGPGLPLSAAAALALLLFRPKAEPQNEVAAAHREERF
jgi:preprotein translocase subunit Sec61beta